MTTSIFFATYLQGRLNERLFFPAGTEGVVNLGGFFLLPLNIWLKIVTILLESTKKIICISKVKPFNSNFHSLSLHAPLNMEKVSYS